MSGVKSSAIAAQRPLPAELFGTALLVTVVVGSGIAAARLSPSDSGLQLLENTTATVFGLAVLILVFGPVSGGHFNPVISTVDWLLTRRRPGSGLSAAGVAMYAAAQLIGAVLGALLANIMFDLPAVQISGTDRISLGHGLGEVVATAGLVLLVFALARTGRAALSAAAVGAYIGAAYWFTSSTSFANPAVTVGRIFSNTFVGIAPASALFFIAAQLVGGLVGLGLIRFFFPDAPVSAGRAVVPHPNHVLEEG
jgi:glycerol uptake facilitator-like aquaporin